MDFDNSGFLIGDFEQKIKKCPKCGAIMFKKGDKIFCMNCEKIKQ
jgi:ribosomal protein S27AE